MAIDPKTDCYAILGVPPDAEQSVIRAAYEGLTQQYHPEHFTGSREEAERKLAGLTAAYEVLADPLQRRRYDYHRRVYAKTASFEIRDTSRPGRAAAGIAAARPGSSPAEGRPPAGAPQQATVTRVGPRRSKAALLTFSAGIVIVAAIGYRYLAHDEAGPLPNRTTTQSPADEKGNAATPPGSPATAVTAAPVAPGSPEAKGAAAAAVAPGAKASALSAAPETKAAGARAAAAEAKSAGALPKSDDAKAAAALVPPREAKGTTAPRSAGDTNAVTNVPIVGAQGGEAVRDDSRRPQAKSGAGKSASGNRSANSAASQPCSDVVTALGLCKSNPPVKDK